MAALAEVLGGVLGLLAPEGPLDRGGLLLALVARAAAAVADRGQRRLGDLAVAALDVVEPDRCRPGARCVCSTRTNAMMCSSCSRRRASRAPCPGSFLIHLLLGLLAPAHGRAGGGHGPFPHGKGWGMGGLSPAAEAVRRFPGPPLVDPPTSPPRRRTGAQLGGARWDARRTGCHLRRAAQHSEDRPHDTSSGGSAADVPPSAATLMTVLSSRGTRTVRVAGALRPSNFNLRFVLPADSGQSAQAIGDG